MWHIGNIDIPNKIVLAPMAGVSDPVYINLCAQMGAGYAISELISAEALVRENAKTLEMLDGFEKLTIPYAIQLFGASAETLAKAAKIVNQKLPKAIIDLNMGCPVPKVALRAGAGSALLKDPERVREIVSKVSKAVDVPVTVKIRSGWDEKSKNAVLIARICEEAGAKAIAIHGRTRSAGYAGKVDLEIIKEVVGAVHIPVIGNGDITSCFEAKRMLDETGCTAVMIGRGLLGNPWLIKECLAYIENGEIIKKVSFKEKITMLKEQIKELIKLKGEKRALLEIRNHFMYYLRGLPQNKEIKIKVYNAKNKDEVFKILDEYIIFLEKQ